MPNHTEIRNVAPYHITTDDDPKYGWFSHLTISNIAWADSGLYTVDVIESYADTAQEDCHYRVQRAFRPDPPTPLDANNNIVNRTVSLNVLAPHGARIITATIDLSAWDYGFVSKLKFGNLADQGNYTVQLTDIVTTRQTPQCAIPMPSLTDGGARASETSEMPTTESSTEAATDVGESSTVSSDWSTTNGIDGSDATLVGQDFPTSIADSTVDDINSPSVESSSESQADVSETSTVATFSDTTIGR